MAKQRRQAPQEDAPKEIAPRLWSRTSRLKVTLQLPDVVLAGLQDIAAPTTRRRRKSVSWVIEQMIEEATGLTPRFIERVQQMARKQARNR